MTAGSALPDFTDVTVAAGTTFNLGGQNQSIDGLAGNGTVLNTGTATGTLTVGTQGSSSTFAGTLANGTQTLGLTKVGAGTGQDADVAAASDQRAHDCAADKSGCAGDESLHLADVKGER